MFIEGYHSKGLIRGGIIQMASLGMLLTALCATAQAATVNPGSFAFVPSTTVADTPALDGPVVGSADLLFDFNPSPLFMQGYEIDADVRRSGGDGSIIISLAFSQFINIFPSFMYVDGFTLTGYEGFETDVFNRTDGDGDVGPNMVSRSASGDELAFTFGFPMVSGYLTEHETQTSLPIEIITSGNSFAFDGRMTIYGRLLGEVTSEVTATIGGLPVPIYDPGVSTVPVPFGLPLLASALSLFGLISAFGRRRGSIRAV